MNVVSTCMTYPTAAWPARGVFVQRRLEAMSERMNVRVVAPRPWFPFRAGPGGATHDERLSTVRPPMFYLPGVLKSADPLFYAAVLQRVVARMSPDFRPDLIDAHYEWPDGPAAASVARRLGIPFVLTLRGKLGSHGRYPVRRKQIRAALRSAAARIAVSHDLAERAAALAGDGRPVFVIPNGIDPLRFHPRDRASTRAALGMDAAARYLVSVGYVQELKGFHRLVDVLPDVRRRCGDVRLLLIGEEVGERGYAARLEGQIKASPTASSIQRISGAGTEEIARYLAAADVFVLATRAEGWCNAIHESLASGTPVVTTDVGGNRELVRDGTNGFVTPFGDRAVLADAIVRALDRDWPRPRIARQAARTWTDVARDVFAVFCNVLSARHGSSPTQSDATPASMRPVPSVAPRELTASGRQW